MVWGTAAKARVDRKSEITVTMNILDTLFCMTISCYVIELHDAIGD
jgi:hypothetical protein